MRAQESAQPAARSRLEAYLPYTRAIVGCRLSRLGVVCEHAEICRHCCVGGYRPAAPIFGRIHPHIAAEFSFRDQYVLLSVDCTGFLARHTPHSYQTASKSALNRALNTHHTSERTLASWPCWSLCCSKRRYVVSMAFPANWGSHMGVPSPETRCGGSKSANAQQQPRRMCCDHLSQIRRHVIRLHEVALLYRT